jgi:type VI secretion system protein ImpB
MTNIYDKTGRIRPPRVQIRMDVETYGAEPKNDLPFVIGVMGDYSGDTAGDLPPLRDRKFVQINRDTFDQVMSRMKAGLNLRVKNTLSGEDSELGVSLKFDSMSSFEPASIVEQVEPLKQLMAVRNRLRDLAGKVDRSPELQAYMLRVLRNEDGALDSLARELGIKGATEEAPGKEGA